MSSGYKPIIEQFDGYSGGKTIPYYRYWIPQNAYKRARFIHKTHTILSKEDLILSDTYTSGEFTVEKTERKGLFEARFQILTSDANSSNQGVNEFTNLAKLFLLPTKDLLFSLNKNGGTKEVLNSQSVFALWKEISQFLESQVTNAELLKSVKQKGDNEFGRISESIRTITLYALFFFPVFDKEFSFGKKQDIFFSLTSQILPEEIIEVKLQQKEIRTEQSRIHFSFVGEISDKNISKKAKEIFGELTAANNGHLLKLNLDYILDTIAGYPLSIYLHSKELLENLLCSEQTTEIKLLEEPDTQTKEEPDTPPANPEQKPFHSWILDDDPIDYDKNE